MLTLKIPGLRVERGLRRKLLASKPLGHYSADYVKFIIRITLSSLRVEIASVSATYDTKGDRWEGMINHLGNNYGWTIEEHTIP